MANDKSKNYILSVCVEGEPVTNTRDCQARVAVLDHIFKALQADDAPARLDAILLPGGFFYMDNHVGNMDEATRNRLILKQDFMRNVQNGLRELRTKYPDIKIIAGIDTYSAYGLEQFVLTFDDKNILGYSRKLFPVPSEVSGADTKPMRIYADDVSDENRFTEIGCKKAFAACCYDIFSLGDAVLGARYRHKNVTYLTHKQAKETTAQMAKNARTNRLQLQKEWHETLSKQKPDMGLVTIHHFHSHARTLYYQRHGIANASAATNGGLAVGAAHFDHLPPEPHLAPLAAVNVPQSHLYQGDKRQAQMAQPIWSKRLDKVLLRCFTG